MGSLWLVLQCDFAILWGTLVGNGYGHRALIGVAWTPFV